MNEQSGQKRCYFGTTLKALTKPELDRFMSLCNFTEDEKAYFAAKARGRSDVSIATEHFWGESKVGNVGRRVKHKMLRIDELTDEISGGGKKS